MLTTPPHQFLGYRRADGSAGIRNLLAVIPSVVCANTVAQRVASLIPGAVAIPHPHGCAQVGDDVVLTEKVLASAAANPNVGAALIIGLGCETCQASQVADLAQLLAPGKPMASFYIQDAGGSIKAIAKGVEEGKQLMAKIAPWKREPLPFSEIVLARECGHPDATNALSSEPAADIAIRHTLDAGGTVIVPEHLVRERMSRAGASGLPATGSLGVPKEVLGFAERPRGKGHFAMKTPDQDAVSVSAMAAGGAQLCLFTTGTGSPLGNAICPVIKVCGNPETIVSMGDNIDFSTASMLDGQATKEDLGERLFQMMLEVCNGQLTNAEIIGHQEFAVHRIGPTV
jgi:altronate dehydratase large subunit